MLRICFFFLLCLLLGLWCVHGARARTGDLFFERFFSSFRSYFRLRNDGVGSHSHIIHNTVPCCFLLLFGGIAHARRRNSSSSELFFFTNTRRTQNAAKSLPSRTWRRLFFFSSFSPLVHVLFFRYTLCQFTVAAQNVLCFF